MWLTYLNHSVQHLLGTRDEGVNAFVFANLDNLMKQSTRISGVGEKECSPFCHALRHNVHQRMRRQ